MSYLVLARKWRPQSFEDIAGQSHVTQTLQNAIRAKRIAHAYLFTGVRGVGKTTAARILARALNCERGPTPEPCNECSYCREITNGNSIDVLEIDGASNRGIDEVRQIIENARYQPAKCRFKIYVIDEVHQVTKDAFNALLKTLEEPPPSVKFILATTEPHRLPETILSRCQRFDFRRISLREIVQRLDEISRNEGLKITEAALILVAREADGSMRDAQSLLEQVLALAGPQDEKSGRPAVDVELLQEILGLAERRVFYELSDAVIQGDAKRCVELISDVVVQGRDLSRLSRDLVEHFRNLLVARLSRSNHSEGVRGTSPSGRYDQLLDLPDQEIADLIQQAGDLSVDILLDYFDFMSAGDVEVARSANPRFALETVLIRLATLPKTVPVTQLLERLEKLEKRISGENRSLPDAVRETIPRRSQAPVETSPKTSSVGVDKERIWQDFVTFVGKQKKLLASHLESGLALELPPGPLSIGVSERHHLSYLQDAENLSMLKSLATKFFASDVSINVLQTAPGAAARKPDASDPAAPAKEADNEMVREALRIFGGSVKTVRGDSG